MLRSRAGRAYSVFVGLAALAVLLQGLWAGIFLEHDGKRDAAGSWIDVHAKGGEVAIVFAAIATLIAILKLRHHRALVIGTALLTALLVFEGWLGGLIRDDGKDTLTAVHVPLGLAIMALATWLPTRAAMLRRNERDDRPSGELASAYPASPARKTSTVRAS
jgi:hypothetical protein